MYLTDTHAHLNMGVFLDDRDKIIERAHKENVKYIVNVGYDIESSQESLYLSKDYESIYVAVGIHPHNAKNVEKGYIGKLRDLAKNDKVKAIGEIGLDYYRDISPRDLQREIFIEQLELAVSLDLPVIIHQREAERDVISIINSYKKRLKGGIFHAFSGVEEFLSDYIDIDFYYGIGGVITYKNANKLRNIVKKLPIERLLVETDCPYLTPVPFRGKRNEPSFIKFIRDHLSLVLGISIDEVNNILYKNTKRILNI